MPQESWSPTLVNTLVRSESYIIIYGFDSKNKQSVSDLTHPKDYCVMSIVLTVEYIGCYYKL
jgi:hypothetical protein